MSAAGHLFLSVVTLASLVFIVRLVRRRQLHAKYSLLWLSVGVVVTVMAASPRTLDRVSLWMGVSYPPTFFFVLAIALLLMVVVHFSWELSRLEDRTRTLAEDLALLRAERDLRQKRDPHLPAELPDGDTLAPRHSDGGRVDDDSR